MCCSRPKQKFASNEKPGPLRCSAIQRSFRCSSQAMLGLFRSSLRNFAKAKIWPRGLGIKDGLWICGSRRRSFNSLPKLFSMHTNAGSFTETLNRPTCCWILQLRQDRWTACLGSLILDLQNKLVLPKSRSPRKALSSELRHTCHRSKPKGKLTSGRRLIFIRWA